MQNTTKTSITKPPGVKYISANKLFVDGMQTTKTGPTATRRALETKTIKPLTALTRDLEGPNGEPAGTITCNPTEVDQIATRAWSKLYLGNNSNYDAMVHDFICTYAPHVYTSPSHDIDDITGEQLQQACMDAKLSAAGLDHFSPSDFTQFSPLTFEWLAHLLNQIETGAPWRPDLLHAKPAFLSKDPDNTHDPLAYRVLTILLFLYRRWASTRL